MGDMAGTIIIKSDQLNNEDLITGPITIEITRTVVKNGAEQPTSVYFVGDNGKPYKPGLSMRKVMIEIWGDESAAYAGKKMTLYRDPSITFGKVVWGGIRISHMSHMGDDPRIIFVTKTRGVKEAYTIKPLQEPRTIDIEAMKKSATTAAGKGLENLKVWWTGIGGANQKAIGGAPYLDELKAIAANPAPQKLQPSDKSVTGDTPAV